MFVWRLHRFPLKMLYLIVTNKSYMVLVGCFKAVISAEVTMIAINGKAVIQMQNRRSVKLT